jgi:choline dehydrogenase-like flavoprotein
VRDAWGHPAGRVTYASHAHELVMSDHAAPILERILREAGAEWTITSTSPPRGEDADLSPLGIAPASYHVMGTCRMGDDAATSVVGPTLRTWDIENLLVADSSVFATSAGYNPTLTIMALAARAAHLLAGTPLDATSPYR